MSKIIPELWQELSPYLDEALAIPRKKRAAWLESLEKSNPRLAPLIKELLEHQRLAEQEHFLEQIERSRASQFDSILRADLSRKRIREPISDILNGRNIP